MFKKLQHCWHLLRQLSGDDAYERYLAHYQDFHANSLDVPPALTRKAFFALMQDAQWKSTRRCC